MLEAAKVQILRAIGVAIVKHGSMFPTMEILLRHAVNYLNMSKSKAVTDGGILDDQVMFIKDFEKISLEESRAVLCTHMLCYVLDGSIGLSELSLWHELCSRVESLYQIEKNKWDDLQEQAAAAANGLSPGIAFGHRNIPVAEQLRKTISERVPDLALAVGRIPTDDALTEMRELRHLAKFVPMPEHVSADDHLIPRVICQKFRMNVPVTCLMLMACFDPEANQEIVSKTLRPDQLVQFVFNEFATRATFILTLQL